MQQLLQFLFKYRVIILFFTLEGLCYVLIIKNNGYHGARYFSAANAFTGGIVNASNEIKNYFSLADQNKLLADENARLREVIVELRDSSYMAKLELDSTYLSTKAKVIDNSVHFRNNYIILNKGSDHGIRHGMGVIGPNGVVGQVQRVTKKYTTVLSLLHSKTIVSAKHGPTGNLCSVTWGGRDPNMARLEYLPRHIHVAKGDSIWTSGHNSVYPEEILVGVIANLDITTDATFYNAQIELSTDFGALSYVYLLELKGKSEIDSLRSLIERQDD